MAGLLLGLTGLATDRYRNVRDKRKEKKAAKSQISDSGTSEDEAVIDTPKPKAKRKSTTDCEVHGLPSYEEVMRADQKRWSTGSWDGVGLRTFDGGPRKESLGGSESKGRGLGSAQRDRSKSDSTDRRPVDLLTMEHQIERRDFSYPQNPRV